MYLENQTYDNSSLIPSSEESASSPPSSQRKVSAEARRNYQRRYYHMIRRKAKEYQRLYNITSKKKKGIRNLHPNDLMNTPVEKTLKMLEKIIARERMLTW